MTRVRQALSGCAFEGNVSGVAAMLALGADVNFYDYIHVGNSPLHRAALQGRRDVLEVRLCLLFSPFLLAKRLCSATYLNLAAVLEVLLC